MNRRDIGACAVLLALAACEPTDPHIVHRPDNLREDRRLLSTLILQQPIYACGQSVLVKGFVPGATIQVLINGAPVPGGNVTSWLSEGQNVILPVAFVVGQQVTATQTFDGATSGPSNMVTVTSHTVDYPAGLPDPRLDGVPCLECGKAVGLADYVPSALVKVFGEMRRPDGTYDPPVEIGQARDWSYAFVNPAFKNGEHVWATQELCTDVSPRSAMETVEPTPASIPVPILDPVHEHVQIVTAWGPGPSALAHGAQVDIFTDNQPAPGRVGGQPTPGRGGQQVGIAPPAAPGKYWPTQSLCATTGTGTPADIVPCSQQPPAIIRPPIPGDTQIEVLDYIPGARILVFANGVEIGDGGGPVLNLTRPVAQGETIVVLQRIGPCDSQNVYQIDVECSLGGDAQACSSDWPMFRHNPLRNASQPINSALADPNRVKLLREIWRFDAPASTETGQTNWFRASPVVAGGRVFVGNANGFLYALDAVTKGPPLWQFPAPGRAPLTSTFVCNPSSNGLAASAAIATLERRTVVIFGAPDRSIGAKLGSGRLFAIDAVTGLQVWASPELARLTGTGPNDLHEQFGYSAPVVVGDKVYVGIADHCDNPIQNGRVVAVRLSDGMPVGGFTFNATNSRGGGVWSSVAVGLQGGGVYVTTGNSNIGGTPPSTNYALSMLRLDPASGAVNWQLQPVPYALDFDPDWASGAALLQSRCGDLALSTMKDGWSYAASAGAASPPSPSVRWQFPATGWPFTAGDGTRHGDSRYLVPGAAWKDVFFTMAGGEILGQEYTFTGGGGQLPPQLFPGFGKLHALNACASGGSRVRWIVNVPSVTQNAPYQLGPPTVTRGIVFVGTSSGHLVAVADPSVWPAVGSRCVRTDIAKADCAANGFALVPNPRVLLDLTLNAGGVRTEPVLASGRVYVTTLNGTLVVLQSR